MAKLGRFSAIHQPTQKIIRRRASTAVVSYGNFGSYFKFTTANAVGNVGPTLGQATTFYTTMPEWSGNTWVNDPAQFSVTGGIQYWTVPTTGIYTITSAGASGGGNVGLGARVTGSFTLTAGETIRILVGQMGNLFSTTGSGGGATFVTRTPFNSNAAILQVAGAGGGQYSTQSTTLAGGTASNLLYTVGQASAVGSTGGGGGGGTNGSGGLNGAAGSNTGTGQYAGGGAGFFGNGGYGGTRVSAPGGEGGYAYIYGATGGAKYQMSVSQFTDGGFGGGGGTGARGGGGGGYNGGQGGFNSQSGYGGSSYNSGAVPVGTSNVNIGHGYVTITVGGTALGNTTTTNTVTTSGASITTTNGTPFGAGNNYNLPTQPASAPYNYFSVLGNPGLAMGTGDYTIEWFQYMTTASDFPRMFWYGTTPSLGISIEGSTGRTAYVWNAGVATAQGSNNFTLTVNTWQHMALVRKSAKTYFYFQGNCVNPTGVSNTTNITDASSVLYFGTKANTGLQSEQFNGSITNIRICKGLAVYSGNFTVPTGPLAQTAVANPYGGSNTAAISAGVCSLLINP